MREPVIRTIVFVDTETSGLEANAHKDRDGQLHPGHEIIELSYLTEEEPTPKTLYFGMTRERLRELDPTDFIDGFIGFTARELDGRTSTQEEIDAFLATSKNATMMAANPSFDESFIKKAGLWASHHRKWDIEAYAAGKLDLSYVPGMSDIVDLLRERGYHLPTYPDHTSATDTLALFESYQILRAM